MSISKPWFHVVLLTLLIVIIPVQASQIDVNTVSTQGVMYSGFRETCDDFDSSIWTFYWNPPVVVGDGTWLFEFPAGESRTVQAVLKEYIDYGTYTLRFKVSARRPIEGLNWYGMFIFGESLNEIDFPENQGGFNSQTMTICIWSYDASGNRIVNPNELNGQWYWFFAPQPILKMGTGILGKSSILQIRLTSTPMRSSTSPSPTTTMPIGASMI
jgi:hypothetical protein